MTIEIFFRIAFIQIILSIIFVAISLLFFKRTDQLTKILALAFALGSIAFFSVGLLDVRGKQVNIPQNIEAILYFCFVTVLYYLALGKRYAKGFLVISIVFLIFAVINILFIQKIENNTYTKVIRSITIVSFCVLYCYRLMVDLPEKHLHRVPMFWYNSGILIYNAGTLFLYLFTNYFVEVLHNDLLIYWTFHNILNIVQTLIIIVGLWVNLQLRLHPSPQSAR